MGRGGWELLQLKKTGKHVPCRRSSMCKDTENGEGCGMILQCCKVPCERVDGVAE